MYRWENVTAGSLCYQHRLLPGETKRLVREVCRYYKIKQPKVRTYYLGRKAVTAQAGSSWIQVNGDKAQWSGPLLAHELAHYVYDQYECLGADHGPVWLGIYLHIMDKFHIMPADGMAYSARRAGLKLRTPAKCGPEDL